MNDEHVLSGMYLICAFCMVIIGYLISIGNLDIGPVPTFQLTGSILMAASAGIFSLGISYYYCGKLNNEIERLNSRIDYLEDHLSKMDPTLNKKILP